MLTFVLVVIIVALIWSGVSKMLAAWMIGAAIGLVLTIAIIVHYTRKARRAQVQDTRPIIFIGNKQTKVFHFTSCRHVQNISNYDRIGFHNQDEALDLGYHACGTCQPPEVRMPK